MKNHKQPYGILRIVLGLFLIVYAANKFLHFLPTSYGAMPANAQDFLDSVAIYLPALYIFEILIGLLLIFNKWVPFILIVLCPLSVAFLMFNITNNDIMDAWPAIIVAALNIVLVIYEKDKYKPLFE